jgi:TonB-dependent receptor
MKKKLLLLIVLGIFSFNRFTFAIDDPYQDTKSNKGIITGRVVDEENLPLPGATVFIKKINEGTISDVNGYYRLVKLKEGKYEISVTYIGFKTQTQQVQVKAGETITSDFVLKAGIELNEVVVNGSLQGQSKALNQQKSNINISNIISSDQVGRFPDSNVGDAIKRIPGINVQYDQGEARFGHIRGTAPEYNSVTIDGDRIPSAEAEIRSVQLDLIPSDMVQSIEVNKVVTSDMDADAIGGSVNMVTKSNPYKRRITGTVGTTYNALRNKVAPNFSLLYGNRFINNKVGVTLAASVQDHILGSDDVEAEWDEDGTSKMLMKELQVRTYFIERLRQSYSAAIDYKFNNNHKIDAKLMYNHRNDWENRYRVVYTDLDEDVAVIERQLKGGNHKDARLEDQRTWHFALKGEHQIGALGIEWKGSYSKANEDRPNERYLQYIYEDVEFTQDISNTEKPYVVINTGNATDFNSNWELDELTEEHQYTEDIDKSFKIDFDLPMVTGKNKNSLKFGFKYKGKSKNRNNDFYAYGPIDEDAFNTNAFSNTIVQTKDNFLAGDYVAGTFIKKEFLSGLDLNDANSFEKEQDLEELAGNFDASENVTAGYLRFDQHFGDLAIVAGMRIENTDINYSGKKLILNNKGKVSDLVDTNEESNNYTNVLPSLLLKYSFSKNTILKASVTNTLARPKYIDLVPRVEINEKKSKVEIGNPDLTPTTSVNLDLMGEHYFNTVGLVSAGIFYKDINDFIVDAVSSDYTYLNQTWDKFTQPINAGDADLYGVEMAFQRQLDFLPGLLRQFGVYANYTYTKSEVSDFQIEDRNDEDLTLPGTPEHNMNASLFYEGNKFSARISYNYASDFIDEFSDKSFEDRYYDKVSYLDFNASYKFNNKFNIFAEVNNILNTPLRYYQGYSEYTMQAEYYDVKINIGLKFNL